MYYVKSNCITQNNYTLLRNGRIIDKIVMLIGIYMQISWLVSSQTELNWTITKIHHFTIAGWYHAIFFVIMFYLLTKIVREMILSRYCLGGTHKYAYILTWLAGTGYFFMHLINDYLTYENYQMYIIISSVIMVNIFLCIKLYVAIIVKIVLTLINLSV